MKSILVRRIPCARRIASPIEPSLRAVGEGIRRPQWLVLILVLCFAVVSTANLRADDLADREERAIRAAAERVAPAVVRIDVLGTQADKSGELALGATSGLIVSADGHVLTSGFAFQQPSSSILVSLADGKRVAAKRIASDKSRNLVLLKIESPRGLPTIEPTPENEIQVGATAIALGRTYDGGGVNITRGIVSATGRVWSKAIQTDAKASPANYGGPLVDIRGRVLGVLTPLWPEEDDAAMSLESYDSGIGFAVPLATYRDPLAKLIRGQDLHAGRLGVTFKEANRYTDPPVVAAVHPKSPAKEAGLRAGDKIVAVDGQKIERFAQFLHAIGPKYAGDPMRLEWARGATRLTADVKLVEKLPVYPPPWIGVHAARTPGGVRVESVAVGGPADRFGLRAGDRIVTIDGEKVDSREEALAVISQHAPGQKIAIEVDRSGKIETVSVELAAMNADVPRDRPASKPSVAATNAKLITIKTAELPNEAWADIPPHDAGTPLGLIVYPLAATAGKPEEIAGPWREHGRRRGVILLGIKPAGSSGWSADQAEAIMRATAAVAGQYRVDRLRIAIVGQGQTATLVSRMALAGRSPFRGVVLVDTPLPPGMELAPADPARRVCVLSVSSTGSRAAPAIAASVKKMRSANYPLGTIEQGAAPRELSDADRGSIVLWCDGLDAL